MPTDIGIVAAAVVLVLLIVFAWMTRDRRYRRLRVGFYIEREKFPEDEWKPDPEAEGETLVKWPGDKEKS